MINKRPKGPPGSLPGGGGVRQLPPFKTPAAAAQPSTSQLPARLVRCARGKRQFRYTQKNQNKTTAKRLAVVPLPSVRRKHKLEAQQFASWGKTGAEVGGGGLPEVPAHPECPATTYSTEHKPPPHKNCFLKKGTVRRQHSHSSRKAAPAPLAPVSLGLQEEWTSLSRSGLKSRPRRAASPGTTWPTPGGRTPDADADCYSLNLKYRGRPWKPRRHRARTRMETDWFARARSRG